MTENNKYFGISNWYECPKSGSKLLRFRPVSGTVASLPTHENFLTFKNGILSDEQRRFYQKNGYIVIKKLYPDEHLDKYKQRFQKLCNGEIPRTPGLTLMKDVALTKNKDLPGEMVVNKIQDFQFDEVLFEYCAYPSILDYVSCFVGEDVMAMHTMLINKPPDPGTKTSRHPMHQDLHYFPFRPAERIVCSWTAMENVNRDNGCLVVLPGTHHGTLLAHEYPKWEGGVNKMYHGIHDYKPEHPRVHLEMEKGDTVFFHPLLIHGSGTNKTKGYRKAISCHYASSHCDYIDVTGTSQESLSKEVMEIGKKRIGDGINFSFEDIWRVKGRLVRGVQSKL